MGYRNSMISLKAALVSAGVVAAGTALHMSATAMAAFFYSEGPRIYGTLRGYLTPPYLYFVINGIIISIAASSRFHKAADRDVVDPVAGFAVPAENPAVVQSELPPLVDFTATSAEYGGAVKVEEEVEVDEFAISRSSWSPKTRESTEMPSEYSSVVPSEFPPLVDFTATTVEYGGSAKAEEEVEVEQADEFVPKRWESTEMPSEYSSVTEKPLVSVRFGHRRSVKASPEGSRALRVVRPKRSDTLESTWKTITDGRAVPLARHLKKSDTWRDVRGRGRDEEPSASAMRKSETFNDHGGRPPQPVSKLRKDPSIGHDDLNRRVEAFINKFNAEMRLQRQESFKHYMDMINRGSS